MRYVVLYALVLVSAAGATGAEEPARPAPTQDGNPVPTDVVCRSKTAMEKIVGSGGNPDLITELIRANDCLLVSDEAIKDASAPTDNGKGPAKVTVETRRGMTELWGYYAL